MTDPSPSGSQSGVKRYMKLVRDLQYDHPGESSALAVLNANDNRRRRRENRHDDMWMQGTHKKGHASKRNFRKRRKHSKTDATGRAEKPREPPSLVEGGTAQVSKPPVPTIELSRKTPSSEPHVPTIELHRQPPSTHAEGKPAEASEATVPAVKLRLKQPSTAAKVEPTQTSIPTVKLRLKPPRSAGGEVLLPHNFDKWWMLGREVRMNKTWYDAYVSEFEVFDTMMSTPMGRAHIVSLMRDPSSVQRVLPKLRHKMLRLADMLRDVAERGLIGQSKSRQNEVLTQEFENVHMRYSEIRFPVLRVDGFPSDQIQTRTNTCGLEALRKYTGITMEQVQTKANWSGRVREMNAHHLFRTLQELAHEFNKPSSTVLHLSHDQLTSSCRPAVHGVVEVTSHFNAVPNVLVMLYGAAADGKTMLYLASYADEICYLTLEDAALLLDANIGHNVRKDKRRLLLLLPPSQLHPFGHYVVMRGISRHKKQGESYMVYLIYDGVASQPALLPGRQAAVRVLQSADCVIGGVVPDGWTLPEFHPDLPQLTATVKRQESETRHVEGRGFTRPDYRDS